MFSRLGKVVIRMVPVEPPQKLTRGTSSVRRWIELKIRKVLLLLSESGLQPIDTGKLVVMFIKIFKLLTMFSF
jgi:hypothetical protein